MAIESDTCEPELAGGPVIKAIVSSSRWLFTLAVIGTALISVFLFVMGFLVVIYAIINSMVNPSPDVHFLKDLLATFIEIIDVFLVATVFYIIALGFYELFIAKAPLPGWLMICMSSTTLLNSWGLLLSSLAVVPDELRHGG